MTTPSRDGCEAMCAHLTQPSSQRDHEQRRDLPITPLNQVLPPAPHPSADVQSTTQETLVSSSTGGSSEDDIFRMAPVTILKLLSNSVDILARLTGDVPPTPPLSLPNTPNMRAIQAEKEEMARSQGAEAQGKLRYRYGSDELDGVPFRNSSIGSPVLFGETPFQVISTGDEPANNIQHDAITRKFYSKQAPPISLEDYLLRIHRYCPLSRAVYLAASLYIYRLAVVEGALHVTQLNSHRLLLAALRVAMKACEDICHAHKRFAKVGGVTEVELGRLEISFCFLTNFELKIDKEMLQKQAAILREIASSQSIPGFRPKLPPQLRGTRTTPPIPA
ncbi:hypothetical protein FGG08_006164 [Glutinoglossum americanum]|uniref:Cyclin-domain-containing protein n=1 Tax=Glutinoglossum americanum TaxID=1670608 RepID=A0A9P8L0N7_9PEZI|nr:hypothetical protein FGG08_006164 [Glutinoglossum americanum]